jgi:hypothetical protein
MFHLVHNTRAQYVHSNRGMGMPNLVVQFLPTTHFLAVADKNDHECTHISPYTALEISIEFK